MCEGHLRALVSRRPESQGSLVPLMPSFFAQMHRGPEDGHKVGCGALSASVTESGHTVPMFVHKAAQYKTFT